MPLIDDYLARTPRSRALFERATASLPGGSTRTTVYSAPYPPYVESGSGLWIATSMATAIATSWATTPR